MKIKIKLTQNIDKTYDKIFNIIDKYTFLFKATTQDEYKTEDGYVLIIDIPNESYEEITNLKGVIEID